MMLLCIIGELQQQGLGLITAIGFPPRCGFLLSALFPERCVLHPGQWICRLPRVASYVCPHDQEFLQGHHY